MIQQLNLRAPTGQYLFRITVADYGTRTETGLLASELDRPPRTGCVSDRVSRHPLSLRAAPPRRARALNRDSNGEEPPPSVPPP